MGGCDIHGVGWTSNYDSECFCEQCLDPKVQKRLKELQEGWQKANEEIKRLKKLPRFMRWFEKRDDD